MKWKRTNRCHSLWETDSSGYLTRLGWITADENHTYTCWIDGHPALTIATGSLKQAKKYVEETVANLGEGDVR